MEIGKEKWMSAFGFRIEQQRAAPVVHFVMLFYSSLRKLCVGVYIIIYRGGVLYPYLCSIASLGYSNISQFSQ